MRMKDGWETTINLERAKEKILEKSKGYEMVPFGLDSKVGKQFINTLGR